MELRPIRPDDRAQLDAFHRRQSRESIYFRYFQFRAELSNKELEFFTQVDYVERMAFVALLGGELVAVARYEKVTGSDRPELAFFVDDRHHGRGLATLLLEYLAATARSRGIEGFSATVLAENYAMLGVFRRAGFGVKTWFDDGMIGVEIDTALTAETSDVIAARHSRARSESVGRLLAPASVALIGASRRAGSVGAELLRQLLRGGFTGEIYPINHQAKEVGGRRAWLSLSAVGQPIDLAIVAVPADEVEAVLADAVEAEVAGLLIVSSGFAETGTDGAERQQRLVEVARSNGMRLVGPNSFGLINTDPEIRLRALFLDIAPEAGPAALLSQSGPLGGAALEHLRATGIGLSSFVAVGNRADVSVNDVLDYWLIDEATGVVLLYVENYGNLRTFARTARALSGRKPIVTIRPHDENLVELLDQVGVVLVDGVGEMVDVARLVAEQPLPAGRRVVVVSNAASVARLAVSACRRAGLEVVVPASNATADGTVVIGDVDTILVSGEGAPDYERVLVAAAVDAAVDSVLVAMVPTLELGPDDLAELLSRVDRSIDKPVAATGLIGQDRLRVPGLPVFEFPEDAARTLGYLASYADWRRSGPADPVPVDERAAAAIEADLRPKLLALLDDDRADAEHSITLVSPETSSIVEELGIPVAPWRAVETADELRPSAEAVGFPVVLKTAALGDRSVGEAGGAAIDLQQPAQLEGAFSRMMASRGPAMVPALVQKMIPSRGNAMVEVVQDRDLGSFVRIGLGGALGPSVAPAARRFLPLVEGDAETMVADLAEVVPLDEASRAVVAKMIARLAAVAEEVPELAHVVLDPVLVAGPDTAVGDLTITVRRWRSNPLDEVRRL